MRLIPISVPTRIVLLFCLANAICSFQCRGQLDRAQGGAVAPLADQSKLAFGEPPGGIRLGLAVWIQGTGSESRLKGQIELWNAGNQEVSFPKGSAKAFELRVSDKSGKMVPMWNYDHNTIVIARHLPSILTQKMDPDARAAAAFDLSNLVKFPAGGRYYFTATVLLDTQVSTNPVEHVELLSGAVEFDVPPQAVFTTNPIPRRTNASPFEMVMDPASAKSHTELEYIQKWNEGLSNRARMFSQSNAAAHSLPSVGTPKTKSPDSSQPMAELGPKEDGGSRWWLAGVAATCAAVIGFVLLRRR